MAKGKFGGQEYKPHNLGAEPATPAAAVEPIAAAPVPQQVEHALAPVEPPKLPDIKVQFSSRVSYAADQQLKALAKQGHRQTDLLAEALNLLFKRHGLDEVA